LAKHYGDDTHLNIFFDLREVDDFYTTAADQQASLSAAVNVSFWAETETGEELALEIAINGIQLNATFTITNFILGLNVGSLHIDSIDVVSSAVGRVSTLTLLVEINTGILVVVPFINDWLNQFEVSIPDNILGIFSLSDLYLEYFDGYIYGGATPTFIAPTESHIFVQ
jgi:hypothetical protein